MSFVPTNGVSHRDADGLVAGILLEKVFDIPVKYVGYGQLEDALKEAFSQPNAKVIITDISLTEEMYEKYEDSFKSGNAIVIDHHATTLPLVGKPGVVWDEKRAGSTLTYVWLLKNHPQCVSILKPYLDLAIVTEDYDLWKHKDPRSVLWTALIHMFGFEIIHRRWLANPSADFTETEQKACEIINRKREKTKEFIGNSLMILTYNGSTDVEHLLGVIHLEGEQYTCIFEELANHAKEWNIDMTLIFYGDGKHVSMRSLPHINILETGWKKMFRGHPNACGLNPKFTVQDVLEYLEENYIEVPF